MAIRASQRATGVIPALVFLFFATDPIHQEKAQNALVLVFMDDSFGSYLVA